MKYTGSELCHTIKDIFKLLIISPNKWLKEIVYSIPTKMDSSHDRHTSLFLFEETAFPFVYLITFLIKQFKKEHEKISFGWKWF